MEARAKKTSARRATNRRRPDWFGAGLIFLAAAGPLMASDAVPETNHVAFVEAKFRAARSRFQAESNNVAAAWQLGRAGFDLAELATNDTRKAEIAQQAITACRWAMTNDPASAPAHYYLGMTLGQLADTKRNLAALRMVKEIEREFKQARELDEHFDYAGPDRNLGLLYWQAPVIASIGSRSKARQHLRRAAELAPEYPDNRLNLIEALLKWGDSKDARAEMKALEAAWPELRQNFSGEKWVASWLDWDQRLNGVKQKLAEAVKPNPSPHWEN